ncbi:MAG: 7,8-didemethyl-8-hydroxy-5-deazariboflavin synthase subunit CofG [Promethearchaeota archaeon]
MTRFLRFRDAQGFIAGHTREFLSKRARDISSRAFGREVTYSKNITLDLSHACRNKCGYCFFRATANPTPGEVLLPDATIDERLNRAVKSGCTEVLITSGEDPDTSPAVRVALSERGFDDFTGFVQKVSAECLHRGLLPHTNIGILKVEDFLRLRPLNASMGLMLETTREELCDPGGPHADCPGKLPALRLKFLRLAGRVGVPFTTGILVGIGETVEDRLESFVEINKVHAKYGHIQEVIVQNFVPKPGTSFGEERPPTIEELLETVVVARNILSPEISLQVPPNLIQGNESDFLNAGVNDFGGISPITRDFINPFHPWPEISRLEAICREEGFLFRERLPIYERFLESDKFFPRRVREVAERIRPGLFKKRKLNDKNEGK